MGIESQESEEVTCPGSGGFQLGSIGWLWSISWDLWWSSMTSTHSAHLSPQEHESVPMGHTGVAGDVWPGQQHSLMQPEWDKISSDLYFHGFAHIHTAVLKGEERVIYDVF